MEYVWNTFVHNVTVTFEAAFITSLVTTSVSYFQWAFTTSWYLMCLGFLPTTQANVPCVTVF